MGSAKAVDLALPVITEVVDSLTPNSTRRLRRHTLLRWVPAIACCVAIQMLGSLTAAVFIVRGTLRISPSYFLVASLIALVIWMWVAIAVLPQALRHIRGLFRLLHGRRASGLQDLANIDPDYGPGQFTLPYYLHHLAIAEAESGNYSTSLKHFRSAYQVCRGSKWRIIRNRQLRLLLDMARVSANAGKPSRALRYCSLLFQIRAENNWQSYLLAYSHVDAGKIAESLGFFRVASKHFTTALDMLQRNRDYDRSKPQSTVGLGNSYLKLGVNASNQGDNDLALELFKKAYLVFKSMPYSDAAQGTCLLDLGFAMSRKGDPREAERLLLEAVPKLGEDNKRQTGLCYLNLASISAKQFDSRKAWEYLYLAERLFEDTRHQDRAANDYPKEVNKRHNFIGFRGLDNAPSLSLTGASDSAVVARINATQERSMEETFRLDMGCLYLQRGRLLRSTDRLRDSLIVLEGAVDHFEAANDSMRVSYALIDLCWVKVELDDWDGAREYATRSVHAAEQFLAHFSEESMYSAQSECLIKASDLAVLCASLTDRHELALEMLEASRGHALAACLGDLEGTGRSFNRILAIESQSSTHGNDPHIDIPLEYLEEVAASNEKQKPTTSAHQPIVDCLKGNEVFYGYHVGEHGTIVVCADAQGVKSIPLKQSNRDEEVRDGSSEVGWRTRLNVFSRFDDPNMSGEEWNAQGRIWFDLVFPEPLVEQVMAANTLIISPDKDLWRVPFAALVMPDGKYLGHEKRLVFTPSFSAYAICSKFSRSNGETLVVGKANFGGTARHGLRKTLDGDDLAKLADLPNAIVEAERIAAIYNVDPLLGENAIKSQVLIEMERANVIHFSTHAFFSDAHPMSSGVVLSGADPLLRAYEILELKLSADLVVLSACQTGRGGHRAGEGIIGLSYALLRAGARTVVASLWEVNDASTSTLMQEFHRHAGSCGPAEAMRKAMTEVQHDHATPYHWAPFVVIGQGE